MTVAGVNSDVVAFGSVKGGRLFLRNRRDFDRQLAQFKDGVEVEVEVTRRRATRSIRQNAYYWGVVVHLLSEHTGYTPEEVHEFLKAKFIPKKLAIAKGNGEVVDEYVLGGSTRRLNTIEFGEFMETVRQWAAQEIDVVIPDPIEVI